jgi:hypothetical protein
MTNRVTPERMSILDEMKLPLENPHEGTEDISSYKFLTMLDVTRFESGKEPGRDKGIDFKIELKKDGKITGFRFFVQLKATEQKVENEDGSVSIRIYTSNINYLLNSGSPAFYVVYFKKENIFLYEHLNEFVKGILSEKELNAQDSHVLRLHKKLDSSAIDLIYNISLDHGIFFRKLNQRLIESSSMVSERIFVSPNLTVTKESEIRKQIEKFGLHIINESGWNDVLCLHLSGSQSIATTGKYNLVIGVAYYYSGDLFKALTHFRAAFNLQSELSVDLTEHLILYDTSTRFALGLISKDDYEKKLESLGKSEHIRYYLRVGKARETYLRNDGRDIDTKYDEYRQELESILAAQDANENIRLMVRCELSFFEGSKINMDYARGVSRIKAAESLIGENPALRATVMNDMVDRKVAWYQNAQRIKEEAKASKNYFVIYHVALNETKVNYEFEVYADLVSFDRNETTDAQAKERLAQLDEMITDTINFFREITHTDNLCVALSVRYEILHFRNEMELAAQVLEELSQIIETNELHESRRKLEALKNHGTTHEKIKAFFDGISSQAKSKQDEYDRMVAEMKAMDEQELKEKIVVSEPDTIELYPIHYFQFPKAERKTVYEILNIIENVREAFDFMLDEVRAIPVANIYNNPIDMEGYGELAMNNSIEAWRNIYRIRKTFFERKFPRIKLKLADS